MTNNLKNTLKTGSLIQLSSKAKKGLLEERNLPRFCSVDNVNGKIRNDLYWEDWIPPESNAFLMFVESLDYSKETAAAISSPGATATAAAMAATAAAAAAAGWEKAREEFETTGSIPGGTFLTPDGKLVWISHYDLEHFEEVVISK